MKKMYYEQRDVIVLAIFDKLEEMGFKFTEHQDNEFSDFLDELLEPYTEGDWRNYN